MKQCPQCKEHFSDEQKFCDSDGTPLLDDTAMLRAALSAQAVDAEVLPQPQVHGAAARSLWPMITIGVLIGVIMCLGAYAVMLTISSREAANTRSTESAKLSTSPTQPAPVRAEALPAPTAEEPAIATAEESPSPTPVEVAVVTQEASASLNDGPISTNRQDGEKRGRMIIKLKSGVQVEADAAWEDQLGIWYRQGGLVSHVERDRIESIGEPPRPKSSPADNEKP